MEKPFRERYADARSVGASFLREDMATPSQALIVGCGYLGIRVGGLLRTRGWRIMATTTTPSRIPELAALGFDPVILDVSKAEDSPVWKQYHDAVIYAVAPGRSTDPRIAFHEGPLCCAGHLLSTTLPLPRRFVHISSTGVYSEQGGDRVDEESPADPPEERLQWLRKAETALQELAARKGLPAVILRLAGLYGPGRSPDLWLRRPEMRERISSACGEAYMNWVRVEDAAGAVILAIERGRPGEIYNIVDNEPVTRLDFYTRAARRASLAVPRFSGSENLGKRCSAQKARVQLGFEPSFPTYREGLSDLCGPA